MEALLVQICVSSTKPTARLTFKALITMKLLVLMWLLLQPSSTPLKEKSLAYSMNMPTLERAHPFIHQVNLNGLRPMLMKNLSKLVAPNLSLLWMDILSLSSSRMVWPMPPPLENPQIRTWTHIHMSFSPLLINGIHQLIQFPPEMDENWVRYGVAKLGQISKLPNWQRMLFCAYTTQLLHSTVEVCWNNNDSYFIWFEFVCRNSGQIASRRSWKRSCLGLEYTSKCSRLALLWEPN